MKKFIKPTGIVLLTNLGTYIVYLLLLISGIISCYENVINEYEENLPIYITYFVTSITFTFLSTLLIKLDKTQLKILLIELCLIDIISLNYFGTQCILQSFELNISDVVSNILAFIISTLLLSAVSLIGNKINQHRIKS